MQSPAYIYGCLLAIAAAIIVAGFASRSANSKVRITLLTTAVAPSLLFAYLTLHALNRHAPVEAGLFGGAISSFGLAFVAVAAKFGSKLSKGWGLILLVGMASSPLVLLTAAVFYAKAQSAATEPPPRRDLSYPEQVERDKQAAIKERQQKANAERETMALRKCANELSAAAGKAAARRQFRTGTTRVIRLTHVGQESQSEWFPGLGNADLKRYNISNRSSDFGVLPPVPENRNTKVQIVDPPYELWSDPWYVRSRYVKSQDIRRGDAAVEAYATAYNKTAVRISSFR